MVMTRGKRVVRVMMDLSQSQEEDKPLPYSSTQLVRYNLLHYPEINHVKVNHPHPPGFDYGLTIHFLDMPRFLGSQLEAQEITNGSSLWLHVQPVLTFIARNLSHPPKSPACPTLFFLHSRENHRTYFFFAFVGMKMTSRSYSPGELLHMRQTPTVEGLARHLRSVLRENTDLRDIAPRPLDNYDARKLTRIPEEARETSGDSDAHIQMKRGPARQFDGTESEWKYRGRTESEDTEPQPLSAPSGLAAQKNEGFQRFYRAVVSPTHVRVTAGGRIVPNNRAPPSPTSKWSTGKTNFDGNRVHQRGHSEQSACSLPQGPFGTYPAMYPGFIPGINPAMAPGTHHYPMIPWHLGMNLGGGFGIPIASANKPSPSKPTFNKPKDSPRNDKHSESGVPDKASFPYAPVSDQFDHNRSAVYNGQWMIPPGGQLYPVAMATPHGFPGAPFAIPMMASRGMATNHAARSATGAHNQPAENDILGSTAKAVPGYAPPSKPPISSIRPSEITKRHLDILRARLKYLEDQLSYNKHQIDEKAVENDAQMVHQYIDQFEKNFDAQVSIEESQYQKHSQNKDLGEATPSNGGVVSKPSASSEARSHSGNHASSNSDQVSHSRLAGHKTDREKSGSRFNPGINSTKSVSAFVGWKEPSNSADTSDQLNGKSTLPVGAAMAAPFQPRTGASSVTDRRPQPSQDQGTSNSGAAAGPAFASHGNQGTPYLVGYLPYGIRPDLAKDTDYSYTRPLTEDELRARHMYWGKAPRHLQKGLPKFDGKDFFPPSPVKDRSSDETSSMACSTGGVPPFIGADVECGLSTVNSSIDPFQGLSQPGQILTRNGPGHSTQSESLPRWEQGSTENLTATTNHSIPYAMRVGRSLDELNGGSQETAPTSSGSTKDKSSSDEADDDRELIFTGRKTMAKPVKTQNEIWTTMLRKGAASVNAVPGAVSSTTAQGVLPHYAGHATASLTPTIANQAASPRSHISKTRDQGETNKASGTVAQENRPPCEADIDEIC